MHLTGMYLMGVYPMGVHLIGGHLMGMHLMSVSHCLAGLSAILVLAQFAHQKLTAKTGKFICKNRFTEDIESIVI
jgi:hypothetical protein